MCDHLKVGLVRRHMKYFFSTQENRILEYVLQSLNIVIIKEFIEIKFLPGYDKIRFFRIKFRFLFFFSITKINIFRNFNFVWVVWTLRWASECSGTQSVTVIVLWLIDLDLIILISYFNLIMSVGKLR